MKNSERKLKGHHSSKFMDFQQAQQYEFQMQKKKQTKGRKKIKRNIKKAIEVSHQQQTQLAEGYYEVESIQRIKSFGKYDLRFYIKWKGWDDNDNTWEPFQNVRNCYFNLKEFYDKFYDNKKMIGSDAWKMFVGCLKRENLLDEKGKFVDKIRRKYNKKKKKGVEGSESDDDGSDENENQDEDSYLKIISKQQVKLKIEEQSEENSSHRNDEKSQKERDANKLRKKITKRKKKDQYDGSKQDKESEDEENLNKKIDKRKRKYQTKKSLNLNGQSKEQRALNTKAKKLKRTYSSTQSKRIKKDKETNYFEEEEKSTDMHKQDIELKLEEEDNVDDIFDEIGANSQNLQKAVASDELKNISVSKNKAQQQEENSKKDIQNEGQDVYIPSHSQIESQKQLKDKENLDSQKEQSSDSSEEEGEDDEEEEDEEEEEENEDGEESDEQGQEEQREGNNKEQLEGNQISTNLKARGFSQLQKENNNDLEGNELETKLLKKRKRETNKLTSTHILLEQKEVINSLQDLENLQHQDRQFNNPFLNVDTNAFFSNNNIDSELLHNDTTQGKKFNRNIGREFEDGSISGGNRGKNQIIHSFDNYNNRDQINSDQFLDKSSPRNNLSNLQFSDPQRNLQLRHSISNQSYLKNQVYWVNSMVPQEIISSVQEQQTTNLSGLGIQRIIHGPNQKNKYFEDSQYNQLLQDQYSQSFPHIENQASIYSNKMELNNSKMLNGNSKMITIDDDEDEDLVENSQLQYQLHNEKEDKDKFTKIRLVKKHDSVEIQDSQPYKHHNQYLDEVKQKRIRSSNYNDIQGQLGGLSKSLQELSQYSQPEIKQQYQKYKKEIQLIQSTNKNTLQKQNSNQNVNNNGSQNNIPQFNDQTYEQFIISQFQEIKHLKNPEIKDPQKSIKSLYEGNLSLKDEPNRIIAMDIHPYLVGQYIFKVTWAPRKKKEQLISSWVEGDKLKLKYPNLVIEFYESFIRFID